MAVESLRVGLGNNNPYDDITATIRGKVVPKTGQSFFADLNGVGISFEIETVAEKVRGAAESTYTITGRELRGEFLYRAVSFDISMHFNAQKSVFTMPSVLEILSRTGIPFVYDAPVFTPTKAGMGWNMKRIESNGYRMDLLVREKNLQSLLEKLFSWTSEFGKRKICWHVRGGVLHIWELQRATGQALTVENHLSVADNLTIGSARVRKFTEITDNSSNVVTTPVAAIQAKWIYGDVPFSGSFSWGGATMRYSDGLLINVQTSVNGYTEETGYSYGRFNNLPVMRYKYTETEDSFTETNYNYQGDRQGMTIGVGRDEPVLSSEYTYSYKKKNGQNSATREFVEVRYHPLGNGFFGVSARRESQKLNKNNDWETVDTQHRHSVSRGSPGGAASQYTERKITGWERDDSDVPAFLGTLVAPTRLPIEDAALANDYLAEFVNLHGAVETKISAELVGVGSFNPLKGKIVYRGVEYYATDSSLTWSSDSRRVTVSGVRWDYDPEYRKNALGYGS